MPLIPIYLVAALTAADLRSAEGHLMVALVRMNLVEMNLPDQVVVKAVPRPMVASRCHRQVVSRLVPRHLKVQMKDQPKAVLTTACLPP